VCGATVQLGLDERAAPDLGTRAVARHDHARGRDLRVDDLQAAGRGAGLEAPLALAEDDRERPDVLLVDEPVGVQRLDQPGAALDLDLGTVLGLDGGEGVGQRTFEKLRVLPLDRPQRRGTPRTSSRC
jgi:hypothetical protein